MSLTFSVKNLSKKPVGSSETHELDESLAFDPADNLPVSSHLTGKIKLLKLENEINVQLQDGYIDIEATCGRCLQRFSQQIDILFAEREFFIDPPGEEITVDEACFFVDRKTFSISLQEMVRQEILLHFPAIPVCSEKCQGLCNRCGTNLNKKKCGCKKDVEILEGKPLKRLKDLLQS